MKEREKDHGQCVYISFPLYMYICEIDDLFTEERMKTMNTTFGRKHPLTD